MSEKYIPVKGDRVRSPAWLATAWMDVLYVGGKHIFGVNNEGDEWCPRLDNDWIKVETPIPLPEIWMNTFPTGQVSTHFTKPAAEAYGETRDRATFVHIWTDADGEDQIERVTT